MNTKVKTEMPRIQNVCRTCAKFFNENKDVLLPVFERYDFQIIDELVFLNIKIEEDDGLPQQICDRCLKQLSDIHKFREVCKRSQIILSARYNHNKISTKLVEDIDNFDNRINDTEISIYPEIQLNESDEVVNDCEENVTTKNVEDIKNEPGTAAEEDSKDLLEGDGRVNCFIEFDSVFIQDDDTIKTEKPIESVAFDDEELEALSSPFQLVQCDKCNKYSIASRLVSDKKICVNVLKDDNTYIATKSEYCCFYCDEKFESKESIHDHIVKIHPTTEPFSCKICKKQYKTLLLLKQHQKRSHSDGEFECELCLKKFDNLFKYENHKRAHIREHGTCTYCNRKFESKESVHDHIVKNHQTNKPFPCEICKKQYKTLSLLKEHRKRSHSDGEFECELCLKKFDNLFKYENHKRAHGRRPCTCKYCGKSFMLPRSCRRHEQTHTEDKAFRLYNCEKCSKQFKSDNLLRSHERSHNDLKPHVCDVCGKGFKSKGYLLDHKNVHSELTSFQCEHCGKQFQRYAALHSHRAKFHSTKPRSEPKRKLENLYKCPICPSKEFPLPYKFEIHMRAHKEGWEFWCTICGSPFLKADHLKGHMNRMHLKKSFECKYCKRRFPDIEDRQNHMLTHEYHRYPCSYCDKKFKSKKYLRSHEKVLHAGKARMHFCLICGIRIKSNNFTKHQLRHTPEEHRLAQERIVAQEANLATSTTTTASTNANDNKDQEVT